MSFLRTGSVNKDRNISPTTTTTDRSWQDLSSNIEHSHEHSSTEPKLRTFRGWKRNTAHLDKSRLSKSVWLTHVNISMNNNLKYQSIYSLRSPVNQVHPMMLPKECIHSDRSGTRFSSNMIE